MERQRVERALRWGVPAYLGLVGGGTLALSLWYARSHSVVAVGPWLINYHGGWVRRGLLGEILWQVVAHSSLDPTLLLTLEWGVIWGAFLALFAQALGEQPFRWPWVFLLLAPYTAAFPLNLASQEFLRPEALYTVTLFALTVGVLRCSPRGFDRLTLGVLLLLPLLLLSHEVLVLFLPYLWLLARRRWASGAPPWLPWALLPSALALVGIGLGSRPLQAEQVARIRASWSAVGYPLFGGGWMTPLNALSSTPAEALAFVGQVWKTWHLGLWCALAFPLSLAAFWPVRHRLRYLAQDRTVRWLVGLSLGGTLALFALAVDWGRFWRLHLLSWLALALSVPTQQGRPWPQEAASTPIPRWTWLLLVLYALGWRLGFQCKMFPSFLVQLTWPWWPR